MGRRLLDYPQWHCACWQARRADLLPTSGYFLNNWVSLAPEYKTQITIHGNTAMISTQCVAIDLNASPMVVKSVIQVSATCEKIKGQWLFTSMNNTSPAPL